MSIRKTIMSNGKDLYAQVSIVPFEDFAIVRDWTNFYGANDAKNIDLKGNKVGVVQYLWGYCFYEKRFRREHVFGFLESALRYNVVSRDDLKKFLNGEKSG